MSASIPMINPQPRAATLHELRPDTLKTRPESFLRAESRQTRPLRIAVVGNHLPRQCGIATFTTDLCNALVAESSASEWMVVAVNDAQSSYAYPPRVRFEIKAEDPSSYRAAADFLNACKVDLVCLQHEYGIFGGKSGSYVLQILRHLKMPVVSTLHTVLRDPDHDQRFIMEEISALSDRLVVMSKHAARFLQDVFRVPEEKIDLIPHGIPDLPFVDSAEFKQSFLLAGKTVLLTFGLLSSNKGFENVIHALPRILSEHRDVVYVIAGATHPHVRIREGDRYRIELQALAKRLGVEKNVVFFNRFFSPQEMTSLVEAADIYITPYCHEAQAVSGTLAFAMGAGKAVISTPYWHATELLDDGRGVLVPFEDQDAIVSAVVNLLEDGTRLQAMRQLAYFYGRDMVWNRVARSYMQTFEKACAGHIQSVSQGYPVQSIAPHIASLMGNA